MSNKALVIGAGKSGINDAKLLMAHGYEVAVFVAMYQRTNQKYRKALEM